MHLSMLHFGCFCVLTIVNNAAAMNTGVHISFSFLHINIQKWNCWILW